MTRSEPRLCGVREAASVIWPLIPLFLGLAIVVRAEVESGQSRSAHPRKH